MTTAEILDKITPCNTEKPYIFISYSDRDRELVWQDVLTLQEYGYNIWLDQKNLDITKNSWKDDALNAISDIDYPVSFTPCLHVSITLTYMFPACIQVSCLHISILLKSDFLYYTQLRRDIIA